jgi:hypothetical protein
MKIEQRSCAGFGILLDALAYFWMLWHTFGCFGILLDALAYFWMLLDTCACFCILLQAFTYLYLFQVVHWRATAFMSVLRF